MQVSDLFAKTNKWHSTADLILHLLKDTIQANLNRKLKTENQKNSTHSHKRPPNASFCIQVTFFVLASVKFMFMHTL